MLAYLQSSLEQTARDTKEIKGIVESYTKKLEDAEALQTSLYSIIKERDAEIASLLETDRALEQRIVSQAELIQMQKRVIAELEYANRNLKELMAPKFKPVQAVKAVRPPKLERKHSLGPFRAQQTFQTVMAERLVQVDNGEVVGVTFSTDLGLGDKMR